MPWGVVSIRQCYNKNQADEKTKYHVSNIVWSLDDEEECSEEGKPSLPTEIDVDVVISEGSEENDAICDLLSDTYGFCVESFSFEKIEE